MAQSACRKIILDGGADLGLKCNVLVLKSGCFPETPDAGELRNRALYGSLYRWRDLSKAYSVRPASQRQGSQCLWGYYSEATSYGGSTCSSEAGIRSQLPHPDRLSRKGICSK